MGLRDRSSKKRPRNQIEECGVSTKIWLTIKYYLSLGTTLWGQDNFKSVKNIQSSFSQNISWANVFAFIFQSKKSQWQFWKIDLKSLEIEITFGWNLLKTVRNYLFFLITEDRPEIQTGMSAEKCARAIVNAIRYYNTDLLIGPFHHRLVVYIRALCPFLYNYIMSRL